ncbi:hypothetical protein [Bacillus thuringiensis]|nr:hypothetical protein [Bacillus thuringiensis]
MDDLREAVTLKETFKLIYSDEITEEESFYNNQATFEKSIQIYMDEYMT